MGLHPYSYTHGSESDERVKVFYKLTVISVILSFAVYCILPSIPSWLNKSEESRAILRFLITSPSVLGFVWLFYMWTCA